ncbi:origin recognition complex subunit 4 [Allomyces javanicus]|nr:origin recognition complex subunit 4 [Allomyces javanicus]
MSRKQHILEHFSGKELVGLDDQMRQLRSLLERAILDKESNSILLLGPHGCGKSLLVNVALREIDERLAAEDDDDNEETTSPQYRLLTLNGLVHPNEQTAFRDLARQLAVETSGFDGDHDAFASNADALTWLTTTLRSAPTHVPLVIVLDMFESFTAHPRQTLLYTLFDAVQSQQIPMAVIGLSTRLDVVSALEKRVRSRFSHRVMVVPPLDLADFTTAVTHPFRTDPIVKSSDFQAIIQHVHGTTASLPDMHAILFPAVAALGPKPTAKLDLARVQAGYAAWCAVHAPSTAHWTFLHLALLGAVRVLGKSGHAAVTFEMVYDAYKDWARKQPLAAGTPVFKKPVAYKAFAELVEQGVLIAQGGKSVLREYTVVGLGVPSATVAEWARDHPASVKALMQWV